MAATVGVSRSADLHRWPAIRRSPHHQRCGCRRDTLCLLLSQSLLNRFFVSESLRWTPSFGQNQPMKKIARTLRTHRPLLLNNFKARKEFYSGVLKRS